VWDVRECIYMCGGVCAGALVRDPSGKSVLQCVLQCV